MHKLTCKLLEASDIKAAQRLLYDVYVKELQWLPRPGNPSDWRVRQEDQDSFMTDRYDTNSQWFGTFDHKGDLIATCRLVQEIDHRLEVEHYTEIPRRYKSTGLKCLELNRLAISPEWRNSQAFLLLATSVFEFLSKRNYDRLFLAASVPTPADLCESLGLQHMAPKHIFKYDSNDSNEVSLMWLDCTDKAAIERIIQACFSALE